MCVSVDGLHVQTGTGFRETLDSKNTDDPWFAVASLAGVELTSASSIRNTSSPEGPDGERCVVVSGRMTGLFNMELALDRRRFFLLRRGGESFGDSLSGPSLT